MQAQIVPCLDGNKFFEIDEKGINKKISDLERKGIINYEEHVEYKVLKCFKYIGYCMKKCFDFEAKDVFSGKSCKDCLNEYMHEFLLVKME